MRSVASWMVALALAVLALGLALVPLQSAAFTRALTERFSRVPQSVAEDVGETTRRFVVSGDETARARLVTLMPPDAVSHLDDVRRVMRFGNLLTAMLAVALAAWLAASLLAGRISAVTRALRRGALIVFVFVLAAAAVALLDFETFFVAFHSLFFAPGTWTFPYDSLLIRLFPEQFWTTAGVAWGVLALAVAALYAAASAVLERRARADAEINLEDWDAGNA